MKFHFNKSNYFKYVLIKVFNNNRLINDLGFACKGSIGTFPCFATMNGQTLNVLSLDIQTVYTILPMTANAFMVLHLFAYALQQSDW